MPNTSLQDPAPTASLGDATRSLLPPLSTSAQCPMPHAQCPMPQDQTFCFFLIVLILEGSNKVD